VRRGLLDATLQLGDPPVADLGGSGQVGLAFDAGSQFLEFLLERTDRVDRLLLADAQTSGGLLIAVAEGKADELLAALLRRGVESSSRVGRFADQGSGRIRVRASSRG